MPHTGSNKDEQKTETTNKSESQYADLTAAESKLDQRFRRYYDITKLISIKNISDRNIEDMGLKEGIDYGDRVWNELLALENFVNALKIFYFSLKNPNKTLNDQIERVSKLKIVSSYQDERYIAIVLPKTDGEALAAQLTKIKINALQHMKDDLVITMFSTEDYHQDFEKYLQSKSLNNEEKVKLIDIDDNLKKLDILNKPKERAKYYTLKNTTNALDITQKLIKDNSIPPELKDQLITGERRILIFKYISDSQPIAGYLSYLTHGKHPTMIFLRGGSKYFGIMRPNNKFSFINGYNVVGTLYRGNIYGGKDEFGGEDINDVENLIKYIPQLEKIANITLQPPFNMMGISRGALEMFISLSHSNYVRSVVTNVISVSGNLDLQVTMNKRPEMKYLFKGFFKENEESNFDDWIKARNPVDNVKNIPKSLKILLVYGLSDERVSIEEQLNFKQALDKENIFSKLITIPGADHEFDAKFNEMEKTVLEFLNH